VGRQMRQANHTLAQIEGALIGVLSAPSGSDLKGGIQTGTGREIVLKCCVPELIHGAGLTKHLPYQGIFKKRYELHSPAPPKSQRDLGYPRLVSTTGIRPACSMMASSAAVRRDGGISSRPSRNTARWP
jgi:hypothetical protein